MRESQSSEVIRNIMVGLAVSFVALSLGAALGLLSGRGAMSGMLSAGIIALITSLMGGTRIQCSGPTGPMSSVSAVVIAFAVSQHEVLADQTHLVNTVFIMCGVLLVLMGCFRLGRFIKYVPNVVISGFMCGISLIIWISQVNVLFGLGGKHRLSGHPFVNLFLVVLTLLVIFNSPPILKKVLGDYAKFLPSTFVAVVFVTALNHLLDFDVQLIQLSAGLSSWGEFTALVESQIPRDWSMSILTLAFPFALQLALLGYLDSLLTSRIVDKISGEKTKQEKELVAQGLANTAVVFVGGIPGAQATIRSVLMHKENATMRLAGIATGLFVLIEVILFQDILNNIPQAVFVGILIKVGHDVFDYDPFELYWAQFRNKVDALKTQIRLSHVELLIIVGCSLVTVFVNLNFAVIGFTIFFYLYNKVIGRDRVLKDMKG